MREIASVANARVTAPALGSSGGKGRDDAPIRHATFRFRSASVVRCPLRAAPMKMIIV